jgi:hypothetical protein
MAEPYQRGIGAAVTGLTANGMSGVRERTAYGARCVRRRRLDVLPAARPGNLGPDVILTLAIIAAALPCARIDDGP